MAERDKIGRLLGRHDPRDPGNRKHIALGSGLVADGVGRLARHSDPSFGRSLAHAALFGGHIDHVRRALFIQMGEPAPCPVSSLRVAASTSASRITDSQTKKTGTPTSDSATPSAFVLRPISHTTRTV